MKKIWMTGLALTFIFLHACSSSEIYSNQRAKGHHRLYSYPDPIQKLNIDQTRFKRIAVIANNNFEGKITPKTYLVPNRFEEKRGLSIGGLAAAKAYYKIFKDFYQDDLIYLDSGSFMGTETNPENMIFLYNYLGVDVATLGKMEFKQPSLYYPNKIQSILKKSRFEIVNSNFFDLKTAEQLKWKKVREVYIKKVNGVDIGFIGLFPKESLTDIPSENIRGMFVQNLARRLITQSERLKKAGAKMIVLLYSGGLDCTSLMAHDLGINRQKVNFDSSVDNICNKHNNELDTILSQVPKGRVDLVISSALNSKVANIVRGVPVLQNFGNGEYISWAEFYYDKKLNRLTTEMTKIFQPVKLCHHFLEKTEDCFVKERFDNQEVMPAKFLGKEIKIEDLPNYK